MSGDASSLIEIRRLAEGARVALTWDDDFRGELDAATLRGWCPCAMCQGHGVSEIRFHPPPGPVRVGTIEPVGAYGVSLQFSDGHATGIYRFDYLRELVKKTDPEGTGNGPATMSRQEVRG